MSTPKENFIKELAASIANNSFVKFNLANYTGDEVALKKIIAKKIILKNKEKLSYTFRYQTKDITKNFELKEGIERLNKLLDKNNFRHGNLFTTQNDFQVQCSKKGVWKFQTNIPSFTNLPSSTHDKKKDRKIQAKGKQYLYDLKITDSQGAIRPNGQDKYKQINHYIEILSSLLRDLPKKETIRIVDMGSGKGYLTFALYDYLQNLLKKTTHITGVEYRKDLVDLCNQIAEQSKFENLNFVEGSIQDFYSKMDIDVLIALHACDTATDDAIYKGIKANADLIVAAPCCHKQIRTEMKKGNSNLNVKEVVKHGIFMERQAEMLTDTLRALYLEQAGYQTKVFDFIATEHTPKNVLIVAQKRKKDAKNQADIQSKIQSLKSHFGIEKHYLEELL